MNKPKKYLHVLRVNPCYIYIREIIVFIKNAELRKKNIRELSL